MICKNCGNKEGFLVMVTDYKPLELWEFNEGTLTRYCQKDAGDIEMSLQCGACGSEDVDAEGFDSSSYMDRPLVILSDDEWEKKNEDLKKEEEPEQENSEYEDEEKSSEPAEEAGSEETEEKKEEPKE